MKGKSMNTTGKIFMAAAFAATALTAAPAMAQDRERLEVEAPAYPRGAERRGVEGYAVVEYTVSAEGDVAEANVVESQPEGIWDRAVLRAIEGWSFAPADAATEGHTQRFDFSLGG
jgi:protein TonB